MRLVHVYATTDASGCLCLWDLAKGIPTYFRSRRRWKMRHHVKDSLLYDAGSKRYTRGLSSRKLRDKYVEGTFPTDRCRIYTLVIEDWR